MIQTIRAQKYLLFALLLIIPFVSFAQSATCPSLSRTLAYGSRGVDVSALQQFLVFQGLLTPDNATGFYGNATLHAVQSWQSRNNITSSGTALTTGYGMVGANTRAAIMASCGGSIATPAQSTSNIDSTSLQTQVISLQSQITQLNNKINSLPTTVTTNGGSTLTIPSVSQVPEGSNLYYTDNRVAQYINSSSTIPNPFGGAPGNVITWNGSRWVSMVPTASNPVVNTTNTTDSDTVLLRSYGYIGDGKSHPLSSVTSLNGENTTGWTLAQWQIIVPAATSLNDEADWAAVQSLISTQKPSGIVSIHIPAGTGLFNRSVIVPGTVQFSLRGSGSATSILLFTNAAPASQGISMSVNNEKYWMNINGVAIQTSVDQPNGTAISYQVNAESLGYARPVYINDVYIGGSTRSFPFSHYWDVGIDLLNANFGEISGFYIEGSAYDGTDASSPITTSNMRYGIWVRTPLGAAGFPSSDGIKIHDGLVFQSQTGIQIDGDAEMDRVTNVDIVGVNNGIVQSNCRGTTAVYVSNTHVNTYAAGITINNCATGNVSNNLIFLSTPTGSTGTAIWAKDSVALTIAGNQINNVSQAAGITTVGVQLTGLSTLNSISDNICSGLNYCLQTGGSTNDVYPNWITNNHLNATAIFDATPSQNAIYTDNIGLPIPDQIPTLALNAVTPSASFPSKFVRTNATVPTRITAFSSSVFQGPEFTIQCNDTNTTFVHNAKLVMLGGATVTCAIGKILKFQPVGQGGITVQTQ